MQVSKITRIEPQNLQFAKVWEFFCLFAVNCSAFYCIDIIIGGNNNKMVDLLINSTSG